MKKLIDDFKDYFIENFINQFGFESIIEFLYSTFWSHHKLAGILSVTLTLAHIYVDAFLNDVFGLETRMFLAFIMLIVLEFYSGVRVSLKVNQEQLSSRKFGRMMIKLLTYLSVLHITKSYDLYNDTEIYGVSINSALNVLAFNFIFIHLLISWMENLDKLGHKWAGKILAYINRLLNKKLSSK